MGTGIGKDCIRCGKQLNYDDGFSINERFCKECETIVAFDLQGDETKREMLEDE